LAGRRGKPFVQRPGALLLKRLVQLVTLLFECLLGGAAAENLRRQGADHGESACDDRRHDLRVHKRNLVRLGEPDTAAMSVSVPLILVGQLGSTTG
jgi:hypothetical protein